MNANKHKIVLKNKKERNLTMNFDIAFTKNQNKHEKWLQNENYFENE